MFCSSSIFEAVIIDDGLVDIFKVMKLAELGVGCGAVHTEARTEECRGSEWQVLR